MSDAQDAAAAMKNLSFEDALAELEAAVRQLEEGNLPLTEAIALYEQGMGLAQQCSDLLDAAQLQVEQLTLVNGQRQRGFFFTDEQA
ncbi:MAG: exodeoxyribonuclease VII small subunit [Anaerolineae bacterium]|nr:exodeoxyribonuclease VII small subunit [Anaerolineae bacterium]